MKSIFLKKISRILFNPFFLSLIFTIILFPFLPLNFNQYTLKLESLANPIVTVFYDDLDNDGESERLTFMDMTNASGLMINNDIGYIEQWNVRGTFEFYYKSSLYLKGDYNSDGINEIYFFSLSNDSILLQSIPDFEKHDLGIIDRFIAKPGPGLKSPDPYLVTGKMDDLNSDGRKELIFAIGTGFSLSPRTVYAYFIEEDSLLSSPESSASFTSLLQVDIDNDGVNEIIPIGGSSANCDTPLVKYHDQSSWLMILDNNLKFKYDPIEYQGRYSRLTPLFMSDSVKSLFLGYQFIRELGKDSRLCLFDSIGRTVKSVEIKDGYDLSLITTGKRGKKEIVIGQKDVGLVVFDESLKLKRNISSSQTMAQALVRDIDLDGKEEIIIPHYETRELSVFREGMSHVATVSLDFGLRYVEGISLILHKGKHPLLYIPTQENDYTLSYKKNYLYLASYAVFPLIYLGFLLFAFIIQRAQRNKLQEKYQNEKMVEELQMNLIRNQLDPHFTMNAVNSIIHSINNRTKEIATDHVRRFANLFRNLLMTASSVRTTLTKEVDFCTDYLYMEQIRMPDKLRYQVDFAPDVDGNTMVPKMMLQVFAENAVRHGIFHKEGIGKIAIRIWKDGYDLFVEIEDDGIGREASEAIEHRGTGKGLVLMDEFFNIYRKYYNEEITYSIIDLKEDGDRPSGTLVKIKISNYHIS